VDDDDDDDDDDTADCLTGEKHSCATTDILATTEFDAVDGDVG